MTQVRLQQQQQQPLNTRDMWAKIYNRQEKGHTLEIMCLWLGSNDLSNLSLFFFVFYVFLFLLSDFSPLQPLFDDFVSVQPTITHFFLVLQAFWYRLTGFIPSVTIQNKYFRWFFVNRFWNLINSCAAWFFSIFQFYVLFYILFLFFFSLSFFLSLIYFFAFQLFAYQSLVLSGTTNSLLHFHQLYAFYLVWNEKSLRVCLHSINKVHASHTTSGVPYHKSINASNGKWRRKKKVKWKTEKKQIRDHFLWLSVLNCC